MADIFIFSIEKHPDFSAQKYHLTVERQASCCRKERLRLGRSVGTVHLCFRQGTGTANCNDT